MLGAIHFRLARVRDVPSADAALFVPPLGGHGYTDGRTGIQMVEAPRFDEHPNAARGPAADTDAARPSLIRDERGATAIEYGLIALLIAMVIITGLTSVGSKLSGIFNSVQAGF
ncbi:MAG TPA: Flp family type IVb pilin [Rhizomicrobium sp.]